MFLPSSWCALAAKDSAWVVRATSYWSSATSPVHGCQISIGLTPAFEESPSYPLTSSSCSSSTIPSKLLVSDHIQLLSQRSGIIGFSLRDLSLSATFSSSGCQRHKHLSSLDPTKVSHDVLVPYYPAIKRHLKNRSNINDLSPPNFLFQLLDISYCLILITSALTSEVLTDTIVRFGNLHSFSHPQPLILSGSTAPSSDSPRVFLTSKFSRVGAIASSFSSLSESVSSASLNGLSMLNLLCAPRIAFVLSRALLTVLLVPSQVTLAPSVTSCAQPPIYSCGCSYVFSTSTSSSTNWTKGISPVFCSS